MDSTQKRPLALPESGGNSIVLDDLDSEEYSRKPPKQNTSSTRSSVGMSTLQEKVLTQVDLLHKIFEHGAITNNQFELRKDSVMKQLQSLDYD